jgi:hypothetical protein
MGGKWSGNSPLGAATHLFVNLHDHAPPSAGEGQEAVDELTSLKEEGRCTPEYTAPVLPLHHLIPSGRSPRTPCEPADDNDVRYNAAVRIHVISLCRPPSQ